ncbi:MAG: prephenate dehydrogenase [Sulfurovum sp.]|nr:prephenate dehydrogenase [Sulfurovum sp.]MDD3601721.1 prephenate dehydrogenase [Sulfurovum sp.]
MKEGTIGIVGLGLMGGSLGIALKKISPDLKIVGLDHNADHAAQALELHLIDTVANTIDAITACDVVFLTIPVDSIIAVAQQIKNLDEYCTVIDLGSTKEKISHAIPSHLRKNFITAHPMTGTEKFGPAAATEGLYTDKVVVLCDMEMSGVHQQEVAKRIFTQIGMKLVFMGSKEHDRHAAFISHMPHALSFSLANSVMQQEDRNNIIALAGGGFRDMSRIAKSSPSMWEDIFRQNKINVLQAIKAFETELDKCRTMVEKEDWKALNSWMHEANKLHHILS